MRACSNPVKKLLPLSEVHEIIMSNGDAWVEGGLSEDSHF
jgi:hypothetical protein